MKLKDLWSKLWFRITVCVIGAVILILFLTLIWKWTSHISDRKARNELKEVLEEVLENEGEKGVLSLAGVKVKDIFYGDDEVTLFLGDDGSWNYSSDELQNMGIYDRCRSSVVEIITNFESYAKSNTGSGIILSHGGYILTNEHVVEDATSIIVITDSSRSYEARIVGMDIVADLAVLKVEFDRDDPVTPIKLGSSKDLRVGQKVLALGHPYDYGLSLTDGIISGMDRVVTTDNGSLFMGMMQTTVLVAPGSSGGPLLNGKGELVGICTSLDGDMGASFAVPVDTALSILPELIQEGSVKRGWLDLVPVQLNSYISEYAKLPVDTGILVSQVLSGGSCDRAGIVGGNTKVQYGQSIIYLGGDIITAIDGKPVETISDMYSALLTSRMGDKVAVSVLRGTAKHDIEVTLTERAEAEIRKIVR